MRLGVGGVVNLGCVVLEEIVDVLLIGRGGCGPWVGMVVVNCCVMEVVELSIVSVW